MDQLAQLSFRLALVASAAAGLSYWLVALAPSHPAAAATGRVSSGWRTLGQNASRAGMLWALMAAAFLLLTVAARWQAAGRAPWSNMWELTVAFAAAVAVAYILFEHYVRGTTILGAVAQPLVLALDRQLPVPQITIRDASNATVFAGAVLQTDRVGGSWGGLLPLPDAGQTFWIDLRSTTASWTLAIFDPSQGADGSGAFIPLGGRASVGAYTIDFDRVSAMPSVTSADIPFPGKNEEPDDSRGLLVALENAVFGTRDSPAGDEPLEQGTNEPPLLHIAGLASGTVRLAEGDRFELGPYEYEFAGTRNISGISVRRDRGDTLIWVASTMFIFGLVITLWFPRRRAWLRFRGKELRVVTQGREKLDVSSLGGDE